MANSIFWFLMAILTGLFGLGSSARASGALIEKSDEALPWTVAQWAGFFIFGVLGTMVLFALSALCVLLSVAYGMA